MAGDVKGPATAEKPKLKDTAWMQQREQEQQDRQERAADRQAAATALAATPVSEQERMAAELVRRSKPLPKLDKPVDFRVGIDRESIVALPNMLDWPSWARDGSRADALNYSYMWIPVRLADEQLARTVRVAITDENRDELLRDAQGNARSKLAGQGLDVRMWAIANRTHLSFLRLDDIDAAMGCPARKLHGDVYILLYCRRDLYEAIYGVTHTKEERADGAVDRPSIWGEISAERLGQTAKLAESDGFVDVSHRPGIAPQARADRAFVVVDETSTDQLGTVREENPATGEITSHRDGLVGNATSVLSDLEGIEEG